MNILHVSPHPDDECIGAVASLIALVNAGHNVINLAVSLGREEQQSRREKELRAACKVAGFKLVIATPPIALSSMDNLAKAERDIFDQITQIIKDNEISLIIAPSIHDAHHGHEVCARATAAVALEMKLPLWMWGLWADLPLPTVVHGFEQNLLDISLKALECHDGENARNDYRRMVTGRAMANSILGPERVFGFGSPGMSWPYAELICEVHPVENGWVLGNAQIFNADNPIGTPSDVPVTKMMNSSSLKAQIK